MSAEIMAFPVSRPRHVPQALQVVEHERFLRDCRAQMRGALGGAICAVFVSGCCVTVAYAFGRAAYLVDSAFLVVMAAVMIAFAAGFLIWARAEYRVYRQKTGAFHAANTGSNRRRRAS